MKKLLFVLVLLSHYSIVFSQTANEFTIQGQLIDKLTQEPVPYASILILNKNKGMASSAQGMFTLEVSIGDSLRISSVGYHNYLLVIDKKLQNPESLILEMEPKPLELDAVEVIQMTDNFYLKRPKLDTLRIDLPKNLYKLPIDGIPGRYVPPPDDYQPITFAAIPIFQELSKNPKQARIIRDMEEAKAFEKYRKAERAKYFNKAIVKRVTRIDDRVIDEFMAFCNFLDGEIIGKSDYELTLIILNKYQAFLKR